MRTSRASLNNHVGVDISVWVLVPRAMHEAQFGLFVSVGISLFFALIGHVTVCAEQHNCIAKGTCYSLNSGATLDPSCSFRTTVTPAGYKLLNASMQYDTMQRMNRGVCAPGLRQQVDSVSGDMTCVRKRSWPSALIEEIGDPDATTDHGRIVASGSRRVRLRTATKSGRGTMRPQRSAMSTTSCARAAPRAWPRRLGKFRSACRTMVASNSAGASAKQAYDLMAPSLNTESLGLALESVGFLASHYCDTPALVGVGTDDDRFTAKVLPGTVLSDHSLKNALYVVGETRAVRDEAIEYAKAMSDFLLTAMTPTTQDQAAAVVRGSYRGTWVEGHVGPSLTVAYDTSNYPLERFVAAFASHGAAKARSYTKGVAAVCALAAQSMVVLEAGQLLPIFGERTIKTGKGTTRTAAALGRLVAPEEDIDAVTEQTLLNASTVRLSSLSALASAGRDSAREVCLAAAKRVFPDEFDRIAFNTLVTPALYARLGQLTDLVREAAAVTLSEDLIGNIFAEYTDRSVAYSKVRATKVRIAGAPRGTWAGIDREFRRPDLTSDDSALTMIVKQARAVYLDRLLPVVTGAGICEHPALYAGVARNAYLLLTSSSACSMILPGLIVPPFADERYDDASLVTRLGFVMAHEFMHVTAFRSQWSGAYAHLLMDSLHELGKAASPTWAPRQR